eukprot:TRINITY_DN33105_c0_g1_i1.p1 TRINITY_DN33105_c0_g1~~TRINITY_DN33105_c0_g1_i1.p1  ORF type:complete len:316 (-),score=79.98 TRINITY_DN33105_c0_g1_i1:863-1810(-)
METPVSAGSLRDAKRGQGTFPAVGEASWLVRHEGAFLAALCNRQMSGAFIGWPNFSNGASHASVPLGSLSLVRGASSVWASSSSSNGRGSWVRSRPVTEGVGTGDERSPFRARLDRLILRGMIFHGFHGHLPEERRLGQKFSVDMDVGLDLRKAERSDDINDSVSYAEIYLLVKELVEGRPFHVLEALASDITARTLARFPPVSNVRVRIKKPQAAVTGVVDFLGVEVWRSRRSDLPSRREDRRPLAHSIGEGRVGGPLSSSSLVEDLFPTVEMGDLPRHERSGGMASEDEEDVWDFLGREEGAGEVEEDSREGS